MSGTRILLQLGGYVGLLLWGTHMVTTGIERGFGTELRLWLGRSLSRPGRRARLYALLAGLAVTAVLQSSTATGLMANSFAAKGAIDLAPALAVMLGANLGSTLITQLLAFDIGIAAPVLVLLGVVVFRSSKNGRVKNLGRVGLGLGLMLMALSALVHTLAPVEAAPVLRAVLGSLGGEPVLALLIAAAVTWACHSSVAIVLLVASLAAAGVIGPASSLALVLGANLGTTLAPLVEAGSAQARHLPLGNLAVRAGGAAAVLPFLPAIARLLAHVEPAAARLTVDFHTAFNLVLAVVFLPLTGRLAALLYRLVPEPPSPADPARPLHLEAAALESASVALANTTRETLRMADMFETLLREAIEVFRSGDRHRAREISRTERIMDRLGAAIRRYLADIGDAQPLDDEDEGPAARKSCRRSSTSNTRPTSSPTTSWSLPRGAPARPAASRRRSWKRSARCTPSWCRACGSASRCSCAATRRCARRASSLSASDSCADWRSTRPGSKAARRPPVPPATAISCGSCATCAASTRTSRPSPIRCSIGRRSISPAMPRNIRCRGPAPSNRRSRSRRPGATDRRKRRPRASRAGTTTAIVPGWGLLKALLHRWRRAWVGVTIQGP
jgi:Na/Pi-cotransporter